MTSETKTKLPTVSPDPVGMRTSGDGESEAQTVAVGLASDVLLTCSCSCPLTREFVDRELAAGRATRDWPDAGSVLVRCPACRSHRTVQLPLAADTERLMLLAAMPGVGVLT